MARLALLALALLAPSVALADAIGLPDTPCPVGSALATAGHGGAWCAPADCSATTTCVCGEVALCVGEGTHYVEHGHLETSPPPTPEHHTEAYGPCATDGTCARGTCSRASRCVAAAPPPPSAPSPPPSASPPPPPPSSSCAVATPRTTPCLLALAALLALSSRRAARTSRASRPAAARRCG